jgi:hypothetical protein
VLLAHEALPEVAAAPPPWTLEGRGAILLVRLPLSVLDEPAYVPTRLRGKLHGNLAIAMFVDYASSPVGPYRELLYIPGRFDFPDGRHYSITRIYVSTMESVVNGRRNWGIPKDRCDFDFRYGDDGSADFCASYEGHQFARLSLAARGPQLPFTTGLLPSALLRLSQYYRGRQFTYQPSASGRVQFSKVRDWTFDSAFFPDLAQGEVVACVQTPRFRMRFPISAIVDAPAE